MKKFFIFALLCGFVGMPAFAGPFYSMRSKGCGTSNEYYHVSSSTCVECDDDDGDAPAKTRAYWWDNGGYVNSRRCVIGGCLTCDDYWTGAERVPQCSNNACSKAEREKVPNTNSVYICGKANQGHTVIGDSVFIGGGTSDAVDCYYFACSAKEPVGHRKEVACGEGDDPNASKCENVCVLQEKTAKWVKYVKECKGNMKPGGYHNHGYTKCEGASGGGGNGGGNGGAVVCPAGSSKEIINAGQCSANQTFECVKKGKISWLCMCGKCVEKNNNGNGGGNNGGGNGGNRTSSLERCLNSRTSAEGRACCYLPEKVATWNGKCNCVAPNMEFKIGNDGRGQCNAKPAAPGATFNCDSIVLGVLDGWLAECAKNAQIVSIITQIKVLCSSESRTADQFNTLYQTLLALNPGECVEQPVQVIQQPVVPTIDEEAEKLKKSRIKISDSHGALRGMLKSFKVSVWKDEEGKFNTARLASDSIAAVVLGTTGALVTSHIVKKNQVENGFEDIKCTIGGQTVADWGDEFRVGIQ